MIEKLQKYGLATLFCLCVLSAFYVTYRVVSSEFGGDACPIFYGSRLLLQGKDPYNLNNMHAAYRDEPVAMCTWLIHENSRPYLYPPIMAVLVSPAAVWSPWIGLHVFTYLNIILFIIFAISLGLIGGKSWRAEYRYAIALFTLLNPSTMRCLLYGQTTIAICLILLGVVRSLRSNNTTLSGILLGLSLAKPTLVVLLLPVYLFKGRWKAGAIGLCLFVFISILLIFPVGLKQAYSDYRDQIRIIVQPGNEMYPGPSAKFDTYTLIHLDRLAYVLTGQRDLYAVPLGKGLKIIFSLLLLWSLWKLCRRSSMVWHPLIFCVVILGGLVLFYHRYYDLTALSLVLYGLMDYRIRKPKAQPFLWVVCMFTLCLTVFGTPGTLWSLPVDRLLISMGFNYGLFYTSLILAVLTALVCILAIKDKAEECAEDVVTPLRVFAQEK